MAQTPLLVNDEDLAGTPVSRAELSDALQARAAADATVEDAQVASPTGDEPRTGTIDMNAFMRVAVHASDQAGALAAIPLGDLNDDEDGRRFFVSQHQRLLASAEQAVPGELWADLTEIVLPLPSDTDRLPSAGELRFAHQGLVTWCESVYAKVKIHLAMNSDAPPAPPGASPVPDSPQAGRSAASGAAPAQAHGAGGNYL